MEVASAGITIHVPARDLYPPRSISRESQSTLVVDPQLEAQTARPDPSDLAAWKALVALVDQALTEQLATMEVDGHFDQRQVDGVTVRTAEPPDSSDERIFLDVHGGAFVFGAGEACAAFTRQTLARVGLTTWGVDYRTPPEHPYPAPLDDCLNVYRALLRRNSPDSIVIGGASAGGNLAAAMVLRAKDEGLPMPAGLVLLSPEIDLTESGDSFQTLLGVDSVLRASLAETIGIYTCGADLRDPYVSPLFGNVDGFPPTLIQSGTRDLFLSNAVLFHRKLRAAGVRAELHVFEAMPHGGFNLASWTPEDRDVVLEVRRFLATL